MPDPTGIFFSNDDEEEHKALRPYRGKESDAIDQNIKLKRGEIFIEYSDDGIGTGIGRMKMGDGNTLYRNLPYLFDQTDLSDSFLKKFAAYPSTQVVADNTLLAMIDKNKDLATITKAERKLIENRIATEGQYGTSLATLWSTVVTSGGTSNKGNGSNNGTAAATNATKNLDLRTDINALWSTVFNNANGGIGNNELRKDLNANATSVAILWSTVVTSGGTCTKGTAYTNGTVASTIATKNLDMRKDINELWSTVYDNDAELFNNTKGLGNAALRRDVARLQNTTLKNDDLNSTVSDYGKNGSSLSSTVTANAPLRKDTNAIWDVVFNNSTASDSKQLGNAALRKDLNDNASSVAILWSTVVTSGGTSNKGNGSNNGTAASTLSTKNLDLRTDINALWSTVFNNVDGGMGNNELRKDTNTLWSTVVTSGGTSNQGNGSNNGTAASTLSTKNLDLRTDVNALWSTVFNNANGGIGNKELRKDTDILWSTVVTSGGTSNKGNGSNNGTAAATNATKNLDLRTDINALWATVFNNANGGMGNAELRKDIDACGSSADVALLKATVITNGGTSDKGNGSNNGTAAATSATKNLDLRTDINALWSTVFNNVDGGMGNNELRKDLNANATSVATLWSTVVTTGGKGNKGNGSNNGTAAATNATKNLDLRADINALWDAVFNNDNGGIGNNELRKDVNATTADVATSQATVINNGGTCTRGTAYTTAAGIAAATATKNLDMRKDINTLWTTVFDNADTNFDNTKGFGNAALRRNVAEIQRYVIKNNDISVYYSTTSNYGANGTALAISNTSNTPLRNDMNNLWNVVFNNSTASTSSKLGNAALRHDVDELRSITINDASKSNTKLREDINTNKTNIENNLGYIKKLNSWANYLKVMDYWEDSTQITQFAATTRDSKKVLQYLGSSGGDNFSSDKYGYYLILFNFYISGGSWIENDISLSGASGKITAWCVEDNNATGYTPAVLHINPEDTSKDIGYWPTGLGSSSTGVIYYKMDSALAQTKFYMNLNLFYRLSGLNNKYIKLTYRYRMIRLKNLDNLSPT